MNKYDEEPTYMNLRILDKRLLYKEYVDATVLSLDQVNTTSMNSWVEFFGVPTYDVGYYTLS